MTERSNLPRRSSTTSLGMIQEWAAMLSWDRRRTASALAMAAAFGFPFWIIVSSIDIGANPEQTAEAVVMTDEGKPAGDLVQPAALESDAEVEEGMHSNRRGVSGSSVRGVSVGTSPGERAVGGRV